MFQALLTIISGLLVIGMLAVFFLTAIPIKKTATSFIAVLFYLFGSLFFLIGSVPLIFFIGGSDGMVNAISPPAITVSIVVGLGLLSMSVTTMKIDRIFRP